MNILDFIKHNTLVLDGGMGTLLQERGLAPGELPERWNLTHPREVIDIHRSYFDAGANVVNTNTFGASPLKFSDDELDEIVCAAIKNARAAATESIAVGEKWVALDIGPSGKLLKPYGDLEFEDAVRTFGKIAALGEKYGADLIFIETMNDSYETKAALLGAKECTSLPVFVSNAYGEDGKLMTGASAAAIVAMLEGLGADAIGVNCSLGPNKLRGVVAEYLEYSSLPVILKPNAGIPRSEAGKTVFDIDADEFALEIAEAVKLGVRAVGGCCGTTPDHIRKVSTAIADILPKKIEKKERTLVSSYTHAVELGKVPRLIGERINPTGKSKLKAALREGNMGYILNEGISEDELGADILDVNVGLPEINEAEMLPKVVRELQAIIARPLQLDTANPEAMEAALRVYNGKPMINSVNGKAESLRAILPLAKKYGGVVVALTLDEGGIPEKAEGRVEIARKILAEAEKYGIEKKDLIFDPLALSVSADKNAAKETLRAVKMISEELCANTSLGVSNVSFGLPARDAINSAFFTLALGAGLSAAIMNPNSEEMMKAYKAYLALLGMDARFENYIEFARELEEKKSKADASAVLIPVGENRCRTSVADAKLASAQASCNSQSATSCNGENAMGAASGDSGKSGNIAKKLDTGASSELKRAVIKGLSDAAANAARDMLSSRDPLDIISCEIIPALDEVGEGFEKKTVFLPSLLMSAEAAGAAFEVIKEFSQKAGLSDGTSVAPDGARSNKTVVLATVKGDIHDIGKNIVKLLLENYGFDVKDLGRDVPAECVVEAVEKTGATLVGLSALMTTTVPAMEETIKLLRKSAPDCRVMVGGAVLTKEYADMIGADRYAKDAMEAVRVADELLNK